MVQGSPADFRMTVFEKVEQLVTKRLNSKVPGLILASLLGKPDSKKGSFN